MMKAIMWRTLIALLSGLGAVLGGLALSLNALPFNYSLLIAPFGATCVLLFAAPASPFSRSGNVLAGYFICTFCGLAAIHFLPITDLSAVIALGVAIALMSLFNMIHPPAGAMPILVLQLQPTWDFLLAPTLFGALTLIVIAELFHWIKNQSLITATPQTTSPTKQLN